ncbi:hypothetical protein ACFLQN_04095 [Candidatus Aenigmatarchaeota archaeon]
MKGQEQPAGKSTNFLEPRTRLAEIYGMDIRNVVYLGTLRNGGTYHAFRVGSRGCRVLTPDGTFIGHTPTKIDGEPEMGDPFAGFKTPDEFRVYTQKERVAEQFGVEPGNIAHAGSRGTQHSFLVDCVKGYVLTTEDTPTIEIRRTVNPFDPIPPHSTREMEGYVTQGEDGITLIIGKKPDQDEQE